jgi:hypothetical protein
MSIRGRWRVVKTPGYDMGRGGLRDDGSFEGEISLVNGDDITFIARRSETSSTAC